MCMGLAAGVGFAKARKLAGKPGKVYVLESDGGMNGGITWEAAMLAAQHNLDNLVLIIDTNGLQAMGRTADILNLDGMVHSLERKVKGFGWVTAEIDGHSFEQITEALDISPAKRPVCIVAKTVKGKGVSFMENQNIWHYKAPEKEEFENAMAELCR